MKCEICHQKNAETAIEVEKDGVVEELYVCKDCAGKERVAKQKKRERTRKESVGSEDGMPQPIFEALMTAMTGMVSDIEKAEAQARSEAEDAKDPEYRQLPCERAEKAYRIGKLLHLEGLHLTGELDAVRRALNALEMRLVGVCADGVNDTGHAYRFEYTGATSRARRVVADLLAQERNARVRLFEEQPRVFGDSLCRALAILKNCRLLSPGEFFDLLSPLRLAALEGMLDGVKLAEIEKWLAETDLSSREDQESQEDRDRIDSARADEMNARFEDVVLNERGEGKFL